MIVQRNRPTRPSIAGLRLAVGTLAVLAACCVPAPVAGAAIKLFALPASLKSPDTIALGPDGALWFTQQDPNDKRTASALGRITTSGDVRAVALPRGSRPRALTAGPDGALWYAAAGTDIGRLGRVTPAGVSELLLPGGLDSADGIVTGADGALWFTSGARVGRLVPGAAPTFIAVPDTGISLQRIIADPSGALWFTVDDTIRRITPAGALSTFRVPPLSHYEPSRDIALTADGTLWFTSYDDARIGRIAPSGRIRFYDLPDALDEPGEITVGPDGAIWYVGILTLGRIAPGGEITSFTLPDSSATTFDNDLTSGPDGAIWFTRHIARSDDDLTSRSGKIGRIPVASRQLLTARLTTDAFRARRGRVLRISFTAARKASGFVRLDYHPPSTYAAFHYAAKRAIHARTGANSVTLRLPRRPGRYRLLLRLRLPGQTASHTAAVTITR